MARWTKGRVNGSINDSNKAVSPFRAVAGWIPIMRLVTNIRESPRSGGPLRYLRVRTRARGWLEHPFGDLVRSTVTEPLFGAR